MLSTTSGVPFFGIIRDGATNRHERFRSIAAVRPCGSCCVLEAGGFYKGGRSPAVEHDCQPGRHGMLDSY
eukprot:SAG31_NODE_332_length_17516_cov_3.552840_19_plen_70_part_00